MCGFAGVARREPRGVDVGLLGRMAGAIRHRGPDGFGFYSGRTVGLAHVRLSIIDVEGGAQPMANEDGRVWVVFNGEIYNHVELRQELQRRGHRFRSRCDTEVIIHGYEEWGPDAVERFNGEFAFAIYDRRDESIFLARDRFGVRPLFYAVRNGELYFGSEMKAIFASGEVDAAPSREGLDEVFTFWAARPPRTPFQEVWTIEPGQWARWAGGSLVKRKYYVLSFSAGAAERAQALEDLDSLMRHGIDLRMRSDVAVGGYLSGGLDSSITATLAAEASPHRLRTFSVTFADEQFDESDFQYRVAKQLHADHSTQSIGRSEVASVFPQVVWHAETPLIRTAPAPLYLLSRLTRESGIKVVLTGEGADEVFLGYDLFKESLVRRFCLRVPESPTRPLLFGRLYPYLDGNSRGGEFWRRFFLDSGDLDDPLFSHIPRFRLTSWIKEFYGPNLRDTGEAYDSLQAARDSLPAEFREWSPLNRAAYLEFTTLLAPYLLSSQGDRMAMAHGVEGRVPFLDHRLFEFAASLPDRLKIAGLREKVILRQWAHEILSPVIAERPKQPYRAPDVPAFFGAEVPEYVREALEPSRLDDVGLFDSRAVSGLVRRCQAGRATGFRENQALVGILSTQLWHAAFIRGSAAAELLAAEDADVFVAESVEAPA